MNDFFAALEKIVRQSNIVVDRPKGSVHPRYSDYIYPMDYGYLDGTQSQDGDGIDVWLGSGDRSVITGILVIADALKMDSEIKVLLGCTDSEIEQAEERSNQGDMKAILVQLDGDKR